MLLLSLTKAEVSYGEQRLLDAAELAIHDAERIALVGRNGAGKSTLLRVLAGQTLLDDGQRWIAEHSRIAYLQQDVPEATTQTLYEVVAAGLGELGEQLAAYNRLTHQISNNREQLQLLASLEAKIDTQQGWNLEPRVKRVLQDLRLPADQPLSACSGGLRRRAMLAQALVREPDLLLLDEPTNHMDIDAIEHLQSVMLSTSAAVVFVTHDRMLIDGVATRIVEVDRGTLTSYPGSYAEYLSGKQRASAEEQNTNRKFDKVLAQEEAWIREGIKARRTRNEGRVRRLQSLRKERAQRQQQKGNVRLEIDDSRRSGDLVAQLREVSFSYLSTATEPVINHFSTTIKRKDRIGIIGPNGSGKSTLIQLLLGELQPSSGEVTRGTQLKVAYFDQQRSQLNLQETVRRNIADGADHVTVNGKDKHVAGYLADFLFPPAQLNVPVSQLSGGEKNRLLMAKLFARPANLLVMDEPTNDLDVETLELLEELLLEYTGTIIVVSHDRAFLDAVVTSTIVIGEGGRIQEYVGGYTDALRAQRSNVDAADTAAATDINKAANAGKVVTAKKRLSYKDQRELDSLPEHIEQLEEQVSTLQQQTADADFYQQDAEHIKTKLADLEKISQAVSDAYDRWQYLTELTE